MENAAGFATALGISKMIAEKIYNALVSELKRCN